MADFPGGGEAGGGLVGDVSCVAGWGKMAGERCGGKEGGWGSEGRGFLCMYVP